MATLSLDLRERIVAAYDRGDATRQQIAERFEVSLGMVKKLLQQRRRTGDLAPRHRYSGRKPTITVQHQRQLRRLVRDHPDLTLEELRDATGLACTPQAIHYALERMDLPSKKTLRPSELNCPDIRRTRARWDEAVGQVAHDRLLFMDESGSKMNLTRCTGARRAIEATGATIWDLPPYSPDLNPIEKMWSKVKASLRKAKTRTPAALYQAIGHALAQVTRSDIRNWFASCGYNLI